MEYEAREKAIRDHNWKMYNARQSGLEEGIAQGIELATKIYKAKSSGKTVDEIAEEYGLSVEQVKKIVE